MSGVKEFPILTGAAAAAGSGGGVLSALGVVAAGGAVVIGGVAVAYLTAKAVQAYHGRQQREQKAAEKREQEVQRQISIIRSKTRSSTPKVAVKLPSSKVSSATLPNKPAVKNVVTSPSLEQQINESISKDEARKVLEQKSRLPRIRAEYQSLIEQELLDAETVHQALDKVELALNANNLPSAKTHLQALDDARIKVTQYQRSQWLAQVDYLQTRLDSIREQIPGQMLQELQAAIDIARNSWQQQSDADIQELHNRITELEMQAERIREAANNLINAWQSVGYEAYLTEAVADDYETGDALVEVVTHEGATTQMRIQFDGQQIKLNGPAEESASCAMRTREALQAFQEQGYYLEWATLDGQAVPEEWRKIYSVDTEAEPMPNVTATELVANDELIIPENQELTLQEEESVPEESTKLQNTTEVYDSENSKHSQNRPKKRRLEGQS